MLDVADAQVLAPLLGAPSAAVVAECHVVRGGLHGHRVHLQHSHRQGEDLALAPLAEAVRLGDATAVLGMLRRGTLRGVQFRMRGSWIRVSGLVRCCWRIGVRWLRCLIRCRHWQRRGDYVC